MVHRSPALKPARAPVCSVCVANYNGRDTLDACLRSILEQDCEFEVEIIVHDDASQDGSALGLQQRFPSVELILSSENVGFCVSNNRMVEAARGRYILLLNNDAVLFTDALKSLHQRAEQLGSAILGLPQYEMPSGHLIDRGSLLDPFLNPVPNLDAGQSNVATVIGACLWCPRELWEQIGGFPAWFHTLAEDLYLCCIARLRGHPVEVLLQSGFSHWVGKSLGGGKIVGGGLKTSRRRRALSERNKTFVMAVCYPLPALLLLMPLHLVFLILEGVTLAVLNRDGRVWKDIYGYCLMELWRNLGRIVELRAMAQANRRASVQKFFHPFTAWPHKLALLFRHGLPTIDGPGTSA